MIWYPAQFFAISGVSLGTKQNGEVLGDVVLPPWAGGSPERFIEIHREVIFQFDPHMGFAVNCMRDLFFFFLRCYAQTPDRLLKVHTLVLIFITGSI